MSEQISGTHSPAEDDAIKRQDREELQAHGDKYPDEDDGDTDATWAEVTRHITEPGQQVEFIVAMGNWTMFSMLLRNLKIPVEDGVAVWPPDGVPSPAAEA